MKRREHTVAAEAQPQWMKVERCYSDALLLCVDALGLFDTALGCKLAFLCKALYNGFREHISRTVQKRAHLSPQQLQDGMAKSCVLRISNFADAALSDLSWYQYSPLSLLADNHVPDILWHRRVLQQQMLCFVRSNDYVAWLWLFHLLENIAGLKAQINYNRTIGPDHLSQFLWRLLVEMLLVDSVIPFVDLMAVIRRWSKYSDTITPYESVYKFEFFNGDKREPRFTFFPESTLMQVLQHERQGRPYKFRWIIRIIEYKSILDCLREVAVTHAHYKLLDDLVSCFEPYGF